MESRPIKMWKLKVIKCSKPSFKMCSKCKDYDDCIILDKVCT